MNLIPAPRNLSLNAGTFRITEGCRIFGPDKLEKPEAIAIRNLQQTIKQLTGVSPLMDRSGLRETELEKHFHFEIKETKNQNLRRPDSYRLNITPQTVSLESQTPGGILYGIQTLIQLVEEYHSELPCLVIEDFPQFALRGLYYDVSRGKVPTLDTLKSLVDLLCKYKANHLQLYIEHPYAFRFDPEIPQGVDSLNSDEILELVLYCRDRRIDFAPSLQSFGHMGGVLSLPQYKHLAEIEIDDWDKMDWYNRMSGATINCLDPEALELLEKMHDEYIPLFDSPYSNVCADETYALGKGKTKDKADQMKPGELYLHHIKWLNELTKKYGKKMMFWGDIVKQYPDSIKEIPKDTILLNWGYEADADYESCKLFEDAALEFCVCPGTSGWNQLMNNFHNGTLNIQRYAAAGKKHGALGVLNTDWGDHGHYNLLSGSLHGIILGASVSWNTEDPVDGEYHKRWASKYFGEYSEEAMELLLNQTEGLEKTGTWRLFYLPMNDPKFIEGYPQKFLAPINDKIARRLLEEGKKAETLFAKMLKDGVGVKWVVEEFHHMSLMNSLLGEKYFLVMDLKSDDQPDDLPLRLRQFADKLEDALSRYRELWLARNKKTDLQSIENRLNDLIQEARNEADKLGP